MKAFIVVVNIQTGEYQKRSTKLINAETKEQAENDALLGECYGDIGESAEWIDGGISDLGDEFRYTVRSSKEVAPEHTDLSQMKHSRNGKNCGIYICPKSNTEITGPKLLKNIGSHDNKKELIFNRTWTQISSMQQLSLSV